MKTYEELMRRHIREDQTPLIRSVYRPREYPREYRAPHGAGIFFYGPLLSIALWVILAAVVLGIAMLAGYLDLGPM